MHALGTFEPADRTDPMEIVSARLVAESCLLLLLRLADHGLTGCSAVGMFVAGNSDVNHSMGTIRRADTAGSVVEILPAFWVPQSTPLLTVIFAFFLLTIFLLEVARASAVGPWFFAVCSIVSPVVWAPLPADRPPTHIAIPAEGITECTSPLFALSAG